MTPNFKNGRVAGLLPTRICHSDVGRRVTLTLVWSALTTKDMRALEGSGVLLDDDGEC